jgi:hypothetical protein
MDVHTYRLATCGFYPRGSEEPDFGSIEEWWGQFADWMAANEDGSLTATFDCPEDISRSLDAMGAKE